MEYTAKLPSAPGWYWTRHPMWWEQPREVRIVEHVGVVIVTPGIGGNVMFENQLKEWEFAGPLPEPAR